MKTYLKNGEHCLSHIEGMPPVVVHDRTIVLFYGQNPATKNLVNKTEWVFNDIKYNNLLKLVWEKKCAKLNHAMWFVKIMYPQQYSVMCNYAGSVNLLEPLNTLLFCASSLTKEMIVIATVDTTYLVLNIEMLM